MANNTRSICTKLEDTLSFHFHGEKRETNDVSWIKIQSSTERDQYWLEEFIEGREDSINFQYSVENFNIAT